jgi:hypothetical protein
MGTEMVIQEERILHIEKLFKLGHQKCHMTFKFNNAVQYLISGAISLLI